MLLALCLILLGLLHVCGMANLCHEIHLFRTGWAGRYTPNRMGGVERKLQEIREELAKSVITRGSHTGSGN